MSPSACSFIVCWFPLSFTTCFGLHGHLQACTILHIFIFICLRIFTSLPFFTWSHSTCFPSVGCVKLLYEVLLLFMLFLVLLYVCFFNYLCFLPVLFSFLFFGVFLLMCLYACSLFWLFVCSVLLSVVYFM
jgi:hypothetical protein